MRVDTQQLVRDLTALGERKTGSAATAQARELIHAAMCQAGGESLRCREQVFAATVCAGPSPAEIRVGETVLPCHLLDYTGAADTKVQGRLLDLGHGSPFAFRLARTAGAIPMCRPNLLNHRAQLVQRAHAANAAAVVIVSPHEEYALRGIGWPGYEPPCPIPAVSITREQWRVLRRLKGQEATITYRQQLEPASGVNLIYDFGPQADVRPRLTVGAHYDAWAGGAHDNGSGVALLVALAARLAQEPPRCGVRCVFFDAEELGMLGSRAYVAQADLTGTRLFLNLEMPVPVQGGRVRTLFVSRGVGLGNLPWRFLLRRGYCPCSLDCFYWAGNPCFPADVDPFYHAGVPCVTTFTSNPRAHTEADTPEYIRWECMAELEEALFHMLMDLQST